MKIRHQLPTTPSDGSDPFLNCKLQRREYAEVLTSIVDSYAEGFVLAINNKWGTGKSTFVRMWEQYLKNEKFSTLYFNAWENDFQPEVMIALLSELSELREKGSSDFDPVLKKAARFLKKAAPAVAKGVAAKALGNEAVSEVIAAAVEFTAEELEQQIESYAQAKRGIVDFRTSLETFVQKVDDDRPVVFIIDELDRCRPDYAVKILENIKHLFSVPGIVFVLSIDKVQLGHAVRGFYGSDSIDADEYLKRFIDLEYQLPEPDRKVFVQYLLNYYDFDSFLKSTDRVGGREFKNDKDTLLNISQLLFSHSEFTLRQIDKCFSRIRLTLKTFLANQFIYPEIIVFLAYLFEKERDLYKKIEEGKYNIPEFLEVFDIIFLKLNNGLNRRQILNVYSSLLFKYANQLNENSRSGRIEPLIRNQGQTFVMNFESKFEDEHNSFANAVAFQSNNHYISDITLDFIQKRYSLSQNLH
ncbi:KAP family NTPase [Cellulophaga baltica]|uniref:KAP family P-loop NTPase fold protein n=1 Tax=Cellulophaga baltica TaxID=76594 RepID=UPI00214998E6|nr:KAP family NTPase [Cellulophaga baltica]MCR1025769.1 KAP family NTPase [Cellulophaga baltica]